MSQSQSIYAAPAPATVCRTRASRAARRARAQLRLDQALTDGPPRHLDRLAPLQEALRAYRAGLDEAFASPLGALRARIEAEVSALEAWASELPASHKRSGPVLRQTLDFLRTFGRLTVLDFSNVPDEDRDHLVAILALEHRWCYAAAGTTREAFKRAAGRTGAR